MLHPLPCGAQLRGSFGSCACTSHGHASRNGRRNLSGSWGVSALLGGSTLCSCVAVQMDPVVLPGDAPRNGAGGAQGINPGGRGVCIRESTQDAPRNALGVHPGDEPAGGTHWVVESTELGEKHLRVSCDPSSCSDLSGDGDLTQL